MHMTDCLCTCLICVTIFVCVSICLTLIGGIGFGVEHHKENNFIEDTCLVIDAQVVQELCGDYDKTYSDVYTIDSKNMTLTKSGNFVATSSCYLSVWTVEYSNQTRARISGKHTSSYVSATKELDKYPVSIKCCIF